MSVVAPVNVFVYKTNPPTAPIAGATVSFTYEEGGGTYPGGITDANGYAQILAWKGRWILITAEAVGWQPKTVRLAHESIETVLLYLEPTTGNQFTCDFYAIDNQKHRLSSVQFTIGGKTRKTSDTIGIVRFILEKADYTVTITGPGYWRDRLGVSQIVNFATYNSTIAVTKNMTFTAAVEQGVFYEGNPPTPPFDPWQWLIKYWWTIPIGLGSMYLLGSYLGKTKVIIEMRQDMRR